jgi:hypothetical protein
MMQVETLINTVGSEAAAPGGAACDSAEMAELRRENADLTREIMRLNSVIANQRAGWETASPEGLGVLAERARQRRQENYDDVHDDEHSGFELSSAAVAYTLDAIERGQGGEGHESPPEIWPWERRDWKRKAVHRQLEVAASLIVAELERLGRNGLDVI